VKASTFVSKFRFAGLVALKACTQHICRVGQNRIYGPYMTIYLVISLPKISYIYGYGQPYTFESKFGFAGLVALKACTQHICTFISRFGFAGLSTSH